MRAEAKENAPLRHYPMSTKEMRSYHGKLIDALNVDVGLLYAAALLSAWPPGRRPARTLPSTLDWRDNIFPYFTAIYNVRAVYVRAVANRGVVAPRTTADLHTNANTPPRWVLALKYTLMSHVCVCGPLYLAGPVVALDLPHITVGICWYKMRESPRAAV